MQQELSGPSPLLSSDGTLAQVGWARQPLLDCNLEDVHFYRFRPLQRYRIKRWDYYGVTTPDFYFSITLSHLGYAGLIFAYTLDWDSGEFYEETLLVPLGRGIHLARNSDRGDSTFDNGKVHVALRLADGARHLEVDWPGFKNGDGLSAAVTLRQAPEHESMVIVIPIGLRRFYYNRKVNCLPAEGWIRRGGEQVDLSPENCLGNMDWGRGVWEYRSFWVWASASAFLPGGHTLGLNMGYGFGDTSAATENAIILDGRIHKLGEIRFDYDPNNFMRPWTMVSPDGRLDLELVPFKERLATSNLAVITSEVHQMFGRYRGTVVTDEGQVIEISDVIGFAEEHHAKW